MSIEGLIQALSEIAKERPGIEVSYESEGLACDVERVQILEDNDQGRLIHFRHNHPICLLS